MYWLRMFNKIHLESINKNWLIIVSFSFLHIITSAYWMQKFNLSWGIFILLIPSLISLAIITLLLSNKEKLNFTLLDYSIILYFFLLLSSHFYNEVFYSPRLLTWIFIVSTWLFYKLISDYFNISAWANYLLSFLSILLCLFVEKNDNVLVISLVAILVFLGKTSKDLSLVGLLILMFIGQFTYNNDSILIVIPSAFSLVLTGRGRYLSVLLLLICTLYVYIQRKTQIAPLGSRDSFLIQSIQAWKESPLIGKGTCWNYFKSVSNIGEVEPHAHGHNILVTNLCETGTIGLIPALLFLIWLFYNWSFLEFREKLFWSIFGSWSIFDDPFNFIPLVFVFGCLIKFSVINK